MQTRRMTKPSLQRTFTSQQDLKNRTKANGAFSADGVSHNGFTRTFVIE